MLLLWGVARSAFKVLVCFRDKAGNACLPARRAMHPHGLVLACLPACVGVQAAQVATVIPTILLFPVGPHIQNHATCLNRWRW